MATVAGDTQASSRDEGIPVIAIVFNLTVEELGIALR